jgi:hypothetical protein
MNQLTLVTEIINVGSESRTKQTNALCGQHADLLNVKAGSVYSYRVS